MVNLTSYQVKQLNQILKSVTNGVIVRPAERISRPKIGLFHSYLFFDFLLFFSFLGITEENNQSEFRMYVLSS